MPIWSDEDEAIADVEAVVYHVTPEAVETIDGDVYVKVGPDTYLPAVVPHDEELGTLWEGDTHDLRSRLFDTEQEARARAEEVTYGFHHPEPWQSFVKLS
jgi:hypothetical protein